MMSLRHFMAVLSLALGAAFAALPLTASGEVNKPVITKGKGDKCVEPTDVMRKNHMDFLTHQRDDTMHNGIRTKKYSLNECINCHVQPDENGKIARIDSPEHFCNNCHTYAAVKVDCFQCHADVPENVNSAYLHKIKTDSKHHAVLKGDDLSSETIKVIASEGKSQ